MNSGKIVKNSLSDLWKTFKQDEQLTQQQIVQFEQYIALLTTWNEVINLTAIIHEKAIIRYHFQDSLQLSSVIDMNTISMIADIGAGAGFPSIPLKIKYPHLQCVLIEVNHKKREFLRLVQQTLGLQGIEICDYDWRTFVRKTNYPIDLFVTRAALPPEELIYALKPSSVYNRSTIVYWASEQWKADAKVEPLVKKYVPYTIAEKKRALVFLALPT